MKTRVEIDTALDDLERQLPDLIARLPDDADFWPEFAGIADEIADGAKADDQEYALSGLEAALNRYQLPGAVRQNSE